MKIIALANQKGGVGKTTSTINIAASLAYLGKKTLIIDMDPQANSSSGLGIFVVEAEKTIYGALIDTQENIESIIMKSEMNNLYIIPSNTQLIGAEIELVSEMAREYRLKKIIEKLRIFDYDYVIIDCPPSVGLLTVNCLTAANFVIVPLQCEYYALEGLTHLLETIKLIKEALNPSLSLCGILLTMFDSRNNLSHQVVSDVRAAFHDKVFRTIIPRNVRLSEAPSHGKPAITYDVNSRGAQSYLTLAEELENFLSNVKEL